MPWLIPSRFAASTPRRSRAYRHCLRSSPDIEDLTCHAARSNAARVCGGTGRPRLLSAILATASGSAARARPRAAASGGTPRLAMRWLPGVVSTPRAWRHCQTLVGPTPHQWQIAATDSVRTARASSAVKIRDGRPVFFRRGHEMGASVQPPTSMRPSISSSNQSPARQAGGW